MPSVAEMHWSVLVLTGLVVKGWRNGNTLKFVSFELSRSFGEAVCYGIQSVHPVRATSSSVVVIPWIYHQLETMVGVCNVWNIGLSFLSCKILMLTGVIQTNFKSLVTSINGLRLSLAWQILMSWFYPNSQVYAYMSLHICWCIGILLNIIHAMMLILRHIFMKREQK